ncbi:MAG: hypothetical protein AABY22_00070 [Nanoarchaeota archaeon]
MMPLLSFVAFWGHYEQSQAYRRLIDPLPKVTSVTPTTTPTITPTVTPVIIEVRSENSNVLDEYVDEAAKKYGKGKDGYSKLKSTLHCLLYFETKHGYANGKGDNGLAEGLTQFHQSTWTAFRKQMIKLGLAKEVYARTDDYEVIMTTAWALANGKERHWGPILRGSCR